MLQRSHAAEDMSSCRRHCCHSDNVVVIVVPSCQCHCCRYYIFSTRCHGIPVRAVPIPIIIMVIPPPQIFPLYHDIADYRGNIPAAAFLIYTDRGKIGMVEDVMGPL